MPPPRDQTSSHKLPILLLHDVHSIESKHTQKREIENAVCMWERARRRKIDCVNVHRRWYDGLSLTRWYVICRVRGVNVPWHLSAAAAAVISVWMCWRWRFPTYRLAREGSRLSWNGNFFGSTERLSHSRDQFFSFHWLSCLFAGEPTDVWCRRQNREMPKTLNCKIKINLHF